MREQIIQTNSLEIFKQNTYNPTEIGLVSNNAYLSIVTTNKCQMKCSYCINSETDQSLDFPIRKGCENIKRLVKRFGVKEAIMLGGEPLMHPDIFGLIKRLRTTSGLEMLRLTTNGIKLKNNPEFIRQLIDKDYGVQGLNISFHNEDFMTLKELKDVWYMIKVYNPSIKVRINTNIWRGNLDSINDLNLFLHKISFVDEVRISNIIPKDSFSVNPINKTSGVELSIDEYNELFAEFVKIKRDWYTIIENKQTLGFVRYLLIPSPCPIIINWNIGSTVSEQVCENNISERKINTFKSLVNGEVSLSWNTSNIITL